MKQHRNGTEYVQKQSVRILLCVTNSKDRESCQEDQRPTGAGFLNRAESFPIYQTQALGLSSVA